jgi:methylenetetrahydrofolate dehydrogenase (NAD+)
MASTSDAPASCKVVLANNIAKNLLLEVNGGLQKLPTPPHLVGFLANADPAARMYAEWTQKTCKEKWALFVSTFLTPTSQILHPGSPSNAQLLTTVYYNSGFNFTMRTLDREAVEEALIAANDDDSIDGIIVYYPIFGARQDAYLQQIVSIHKDVEGLSHRYLFNMYQNIRFLDDENMRKSILPCTPLAVIKILEYLRVYNTILPYGNRLFGHSISVVNRSEVVGRPLAALLANDGACVYSVDVTGVQQFSRGEGIKKRRHEVVDKEGWGLEECVPLCDVVISGVPGEGFKFPTKLLREGAVCINFSTDKVWFLLSSELDRSSWLLNRTSDPTLKRRRQSTCQPSAKSR